MNKTKPNTLRKRKWRITYITKHQTRMNLLHPLQDNYAVKNKKKMSKMTNTYRSINLSKLWAVG